MVTFHVACQNPARWASNLPFGQDCKDNLGIGDFFNKITLPKKSSEPQNPETPKTVSLLQNKTKHQRLVASHQDHLTTGMASHHPRDGPWNRWTRQLLGLIHRFNTSKRPTSHRQIVCLVLPPGWLAKCCDSEVCSKGRVYLPGSQARR